MEDVEILISPDLETGKQIVRVLNRVNYLEGIIDLDFRQNQAR